MQRKVIVGNSKTEKEPDVILLYLACGHFWVVLVF